MSNDVPDIQDLIDESFALESVGTKIQQDEGGGLGEDEIAAFVEQYDQWYAKCLAILPDSYTGRFSKEYEGTTFSFSIKKFLSGPSELNSFYTSETSSLFTRWLYPYNDAFRNRLRAQRQILREVLTRQQIAANQQEKVRQQLWREITEGFVFIAMPMNPENPTFDDVHDAIKEVAVRLGLNAERVDDPQTNERITDRILESLAKAEYVVADLTDGKANVYFEAGYAHALGKTPIYIAKAGTKLEFDLKDYPVLFFKNMKELKSLLQTRLAGLLNSKQSE